MMHLKVAFSGTVEELKQALGLGGQPDPGEPSADREELDGLSAAEWREEAHKARREAAAAWDSAAKAHTAAIEAKARASADKANGEAEVDRMRSHITHAHKALDGAGVGKHTLAVGHRILELVQERDSHAAKVEAVWGGLGCAKQEHDALRAEVETLKADLGAEHKGNMLLRQEFGARDGETLRGLVSRLHAEVERLRAAVTAQQTHMRAEKPEPRTLSREEVDVVAAKLNEVWRVTETPLEAARGELRVLERAGYLSVRLPE